MMASVRRNIVVFGESGVGKSSLINLLVGKKAAPTSSSAIGCTLEFSKYPSPCGKYYYYDTAGFNEGSAGAVKASVAISNVIKLLKSLRDDGGVNLLIYVIKKGRITKDLEKNYQLFVETICQKKVPTVLVITHCENEVEMGNWWLEEKNGFENKYKMTFEATVSACTTKGEDLNALLRPFYEQRFGETCVQMDSALKHQLKDGWVMPNWITWFTKISKSFINFWRTSFKYSELAMHEPLKEALKENGMPEEQAITICNEICMASV